MIKRKRIVETIIPSTPFGITGGSGSYGFEKYKTNDLSVETPYGRIVVEMIHYKGIDVAFIARHSIDYQCPPHQTNYRGIIKAFETLGVEYLMGSSAVTSVNPDMAPGQLVLLDDFMDFTKNRLYTYHQDGEVLAHVDMNEPYCHHLRNKLMEQATLDQLNIMPKATYVATEGPRRETRAEAGFYQKMGWDVLGMTNVPEVILAKEKGICYLNLGLVTRWANNEPPKKEALTKDEHAKIRQQMMGLFLNTYLNQKIDHDHCRCQLALNTL